MKSLRGKPLSIIFLGFNSLLSRQAAGNLTQERLKKLLVFSIAIFLTMPSWVQGSESNPILIGATVSLEGKYSEPSLMIQNAFRLWEQEVNLRGGFLGRPVKLILYDDKSQKKRVRQLYKKLILEDKVDLVFSPYGTPLTLEASKVSEKNKMVMLAYAASQILERAITQTKSLNRDKISDYIRAMDTVTVIGRFKVDPKGKQIGHNPIMIQWQKGEKEIVYPEFLWKAIIASGFSQTTRAKEAHKLGAGQYVRKPYALKQLGVAVRTELRKQSFRSPSANHPEIDHQSS